MVLALATSAASTLCLNVLGCADGTAPVTRAGWAWGFVLMYGVRVVPAAVVGWAATRVRGSWVRRWSTLSGVVLALCGAGGLGLWVLVRIPGDDPYALAQAPHFWAILAVSVLVPALVGTAVLAPWTRFRHLQIIPVLSRFSN
ncbi:MAG TPA: hypothetical protein VGQ83_03085 [Polyangia bacterium]